MHNLKTYNEFNLLNENKINSFIEKANKYLPSIIDKILSKLSSKKIEKLKEELFPYKNLSRKEIEEKLRSKLKLKESNNIENLDPYGEEEWDEEKNMRNFKIRKIKRKIARIITTSFMGLSGALIVVHVITWSLLALTKMQSFSNNSINWKTPWGSWKFSF